MELKKLIEELEHLRSQVGDDKEVYVQSHNSKGLLTHFEIVGAIVGNESNEIELEIEDFE